MPPVAAGAPAPRASSAAERIASAQRAWAATVVVDLARPDADQERMVSILVAVKNAVIGNKTRKRVLAQAGVVPRLAELLADTWPDPVRINAAVVLGSLALGARTSAPYCCCRDKPVYSAIVCNSCLSIAGVTRGPGGCQPRGRGGRHGGACAHDRQPVAARHGGRRARPQAPHRQLCVHRHGHTAGRGASIAFSGIQIAHPIAICRFPFCLGPMRNRPTSCRRWWSGLT